MVNVQLYWGRGMFHSTSSSKIIEETPSPVVEQEQCEALSKIIADVCTLGYRGAGTMEMLRDQSGEIFYGNEHAFAS